MGTVEQALSIATTMDPIIVAVSDSTDDEGCKEPMTPDGTGSQNPAIRGSKGISKNAGPPTKLTDFSPGNMRKYYSELADLIGDESDSNLHNDSDDSDYDVAGNKESDGEGEDEDFDPGASEDEKPKSRKRKATHSPPKSVASPAKKRMTGGMRTRITERILAAPKTRGKTQYAKLKDAFGISEEMLTKGGNGKKKSNGA